MKSSFRYQKLFGVLSLMVLSSIRLIGDTSNQPLPNIIFILADDMGYGDVETLNSNSRIPTPHLNKLAQNGMTFTDAHTSSSVCTPTRYALLTGRYNWRSRLKSSVTWGFSKRLIEDDRETVASVLSKAGYKTSCIGKWHLGINWPLVGGGTADDGNKWDSKYRGGWNVDYSKKISQGPTSLGFDHFFGISASLDMPPYVYIQNDQPIAYEIVEKAFNRKGPADSDFEAVDVQPRIAYETIRKINKWAPDSKKGKPFFIYVPLAAPHTPIVPTTEWKGRSGLNPYGDFTMQVDDTVGQIYQALERTDILSNTILIFSTDNGCSPAANLKDMEAKGHFANAPWRGHKADIFEGGHHVPFFVHWPEVIKPGSISDRLTCQTDFLATCAELTGQELSVNVAEDSFSFLNELHGKSSSDIDVNQRKRSVIHHSINGSFAIREGDWKLILCPGSGGWSAPRPRSAKTKQLPAIQLYNLAKDPAESENLYSEHPKIVQNLYHILKSYVAKGRSTPGPDGMNTTPVDILAGIPGGKWEF